MRISVGCTGYCNFPNTPPPSPIYLYAVDAGGNLWWKHPDPTGTWLPYCCRVNSGWQIYKKVVSLGFNNFAALGADGSLTWYQHVGYSDGTATWLGPTPIGNGIDWNQYTSIFSGGDGIIYAIQPDGQLIWWQNLGYATGTQNWQGPSPVGYVWGGFQNVFSMGQGIIYAVQQDGTLLWYKHNGYQDGSFNWTGPYQVGSNWQQFTNIIPAGNGVIMATQPDGTLLWYKHDNYLVGISSAPGGIYDAQPRAVWEGGIPIGPPGWNGPSQIFSILFTPDSQIN